MIVPMHYIPHCTFCGHTLPDETKDNWPRQCRGCGEFNYNSPKPVVALVLHAWDSKVGHTGCIVIKRGIKPFKNGWAYPGGYLDHAEDWKAAAVREGKEELGIDINPEDLWLMEIVSTKSNYLVFFVGTSQDFHPKDWANFDLTKGVNDKGEQEVLEIKIVQYGSDFNLDVPAHNRFWKNGISETTGISEGR